MPPSEDEDDKRPIQGSRPERIPLTWKDYVALFIAALETVLLPLVILVVVLFVFVLIVTGHV